MKSIDNNLFSVHPESKALKRTEMRTKNYIYSSEVLNYVAHYR